MQARLFYEETLVRLHVLADSDLDEAQRVKLCVVKAIRQKAARLAGQAHSAGEAFAILSRAKPALRRVARHAARRERFNGDVRVETGVYPFDDRQYGDKLVPAGDYRAVRVVLGTGKGHNWWCVLYPELCAVEEACAQALSSPDAVHFYTRIGDYLSTLFKGAGL
ncbi:MAG: stage II sporulation protein R [Clostridia bacterium]